MKIKLAIFLALVISPLIFSSCKKKEGLPLSDGTIPSSQSGSAVGAKAPAVLLRGAKGATRELSSYRGKVVILSFWATWCPPCLEELPSLQRLYRAFKEEGLAVLSISVDQESSSGDVEALLRKLSIEFDNFYDFDGEVSRLFSVRGIPNNVIIGADGKIVFQEYGPQEWDSQKHIAMIRKLLQQEGRDG